MKSDADNMRFSAVGAAQAMSTSAVIGHFCSMERLEDWAMDDRAVEW